MKRYNNLFHKIVTIDNLILADKKARKGKSNNIDIIEFDKEWYINILELYDELINKTYTTSEYYVFTIYEPKKRLISKLPYKDRIVHHAIMNVLEPIILNSLTINTYSCIKCRGIHKCLKRLKISLLDIDNTKYCLKLDINKFYPSIDNNILKALLRNKFKDKDLLWLLDDIINSNEGLPLGNYLSQWLSNYYLNGLDHYIKEVLKVKYYFRYCDDMVILSSNKQELHYILQSIRIYLNSKLKLSIKNNYQIYPINKRGIDFIGYKFYHTHILLRKRIKKSFINMIKYNKNIKSISSYKGWLKWCNSYKLQNKYLNERNNN